MAMRIRVRTMVAVTAGLCTLAFIEAAQAKTTQTTYWFCDLSLNSMGATVGFTDVAALPPGISESKPSREYKRWVEAVRSGRVDVGLSRDDRAFAQGSCRGFTTEASAAEQYRLHYDSRPTYKRFPSPFDADGNVILAGDPPRSVPSSAAAQVATAELPSAKLSAPSTETMHSAEEARAAREAAWEAKLAQHQREVEAHQKQLAERDQAIAAEAARVEAAKQAAATKLDEHKKELATHRATVAHMEREAAAVRAAWAERVIAAQRGSAAAAPSVPVAGEMATYRVYSKFGTESEEKARESLINLERSLGGKEVTNIQCSYIIFDGDKEWTCTGDALGRKVAPQSASGQ